MTLPRAGDHLETVAFEKGVEVDLTLVDDGQAGLFRETYTRLCFHRFCGVEELLAPGAVAGGRETFGRVRYPGVVYCTLGSLLPMFRPGTFVARFDCIGTVSCIGRSPPRLGASWLCDIL